MPATKLSRDSKSSQVSHLHAGQNSESRPVPGPAVQNSELYFAGNTGDDIFLGQSSRLPFAAGKGMRPCRLSAVDQLQVCDPRLPQKRDRFGPDLPDPRSEIYAADQQIPAQLSRQLSRRAGQRRRPLRQTRAIIKWPSDVSVSQNQQLLLHLDNLEHPGGLGLNSPWEWLSTTKHRYDSGTDGQHY